MQSTRNDTEGQESSLAADASRTAPSDRLAEIVAAKRVELAGLAPRESELRARAMAAPPARSLGAALRDPGEVRLLAEIKRRSPSAGAIRPGADPAAVARAYVAGGAAALSVLTDRAFFDGSLEALERVREAVDVPLLRKDFLLGAAQVYEARAAGADAVLLIVRILSAGELAELGGVARSLGMDALVEVHDERELETALELGFDLIGVNSRDLATFRTDLGVIERLAREAPPSVTLVAESGIHTPADVRRMGEAGVEAVLVGESLMRQPDVEAAAAALARHPRVARGSAPA